MQLLATIAAAVMALSATAIGLHVLAWVHLLWLRRRRRTEPAPPPLAGDDLPTLTLQLPLYNEASVARELLECCARLDWPDLQIQVLDDSTDETVAIVAEAVARLSAQGTDIVHLRRDHREGFKAGALAEGLETARGELIAILDADFRPAPGWLRRAVASLGPQDGLVQCRWGFRNPRASVLTRAQALHLDAHFALEQEARSSGGLLMGFNGTAGVWRRACIDAAGGWEGDTLTEDLDLSYRAQLAGWNLRYVDDIVVLSDLPEALQAVRAQQHRWIRGGAQVARKLLTSLWSTRLPLRRKVQGTAHLLASSVFLPVLALCVITPALPLIQAEAGLLAEVLLAYAGWLLRGVLLVLVTAYSTVCVHRAGSLGEGLGRLLRDLPPFMALVTAICVHDAWAALLGWVGPTGTFVRTPKGLQPISRRLPGGLALESGLAVWSWTGLALGVQQAQWALLPFLGFQAVAFTALVVLTLRAPPTVAPAS